jgi:hypothetical protein
MLRRPCWGANDLRKKQKGWPIKKKEMIKCLNADECYPTALEIEEINAWTQSKIMNTIKKGVNDSKSDSTF